ncbi:MAG: tautomerase family protein [Verrucomicrobiota bacterium]|jgi:4-oxalocrotonate tautomerase
MPHIIAKLATGKPDQVKARLAEAIVKSVMEVLNCGEAPVSLAIEEIEPRDWAEKVYKPEILNGPGKLYQKPGYTI